MRIILATKSPYRHQIFRELGFDFAAEPSGINEQFEERPERPEELVKLLAKMKAKAVAKNKSDGIVIGFDSVVYFEGKILEKPASKEEEFERLMKMSGRRFQFYTGIFMINIEKCKNISDCVVTSAEMRNITESEIRKYLNQDNNFNTYALGFDPLGSYGSTFVSRIEGSYNNLLRGIPTERIMEMLFEVGFSF